MVHLVFVVAEPARGNIHVQVVARRETVLCQRHLGPHVQEVAGLVVVPAAVGQEIALVIDRNTAQAIAAQGGEVAFTYQGEALEKRVRPLAERAYEFALAAGMPA